VKRLVDVTSQLFENEQLRKKMGKNGKKLTNFLNGLLNHERKHIILTIREKISFTR